MTQHLCLCPLCGEGPVHESRFEEPFEYKGRTVSLSLFCKECDACGSDFGDSAVSKKNQRIINHAKKRIDNLLSATSVAGLRKKWNITQADAGRIFGGGPVAFSKYESDDVMQSEAMDKLLRVADAVPEAKRWLLQYAGLANRDDKVTISVGETMSLLRASVVNLHSSHTTAIGAVYTIGVPEVGVIIPGADSDSLFEESIAGHHRFTKTVRVEPIVRHYGDEENQSYLHRPRYSEQEYDLYSV